jgi:hypothetical protein
LLKKDSFRRSVVNTAGGAWGRRHNLLAATTLFKVQRLRRFKVQGGVGTLNVEHGTLNEIFLLNSLAFRRGVLLSKRAAPKSA